MTIKTLVLRSIALAFCAFFLGCLVASAFLFNGIICFCLAFLFGCLGVFAFKRSNFKYLMLFICFFFAGCLVFTLGAKNYTSVSDADYIFTGMVEQVIANSESEKVVVLTDTTYKGDNEPTKLDGKVRLKIKDMSYQPKYGDIIAYYGKTYLPAGQVNPNGFDYATYLKTREIGYTATATSINVIGHNDDFSIYGFSQNIRSQISENIKTNIPGDSNASLVSSIIIGDKEDFSPQMYDDFRDSGIAHILAISGLHIGIIVAALFFVLKKLRMNSTFILLTLIAFLVIYSFVSGFSYSVVRASIMSIVLLYARLFGKRFDSINALCIAGFCIIIYNPYTVFSASFLLSFSSILGIGCFYKKFCKFFAKFKLPNYFVQSMSVYFAAQLGILPLLILLFNEVQLLGLITNFIAIPLITIAVVVGFFGCALSLIFVGLGYYPMVVTSGIMMMIGEAASVINQIPFGVVTIATPISFIVLAYYGLLFFCVIFFISKAILSVVYKAIALVLMFVLFVNTSAFSGNPKITMLDVGNGQSIHAVSNNNKHVLFDVGGEYPTTYSYLKSIGVNEVTIVLTANHLEHYSGLQNILGNIKITEIFTTVLSGDDVYVGLLEKARTLGIPITLMKRGDKLDFSGGLTFDVMSPQKTTAMDISGTSLMGYLKQDDFTMLLTGDIKTKDSEIYLNELEKVDVLQVPNHGDVDGVSFEMANITNPKYALVSSWYETKNNVVGLFLSSKVYTTNKNGAIIIDINKNDYTVKCMID